MIGNLEHIVFIQIDPFPSMAGAGGMRIGSSGKDESSDGAEMVLFLTLEWQEQPRQSGRDRNKSGEPY